MKGATSNGLSAFHDTPYSRTPSATAATVMVTRLRRRPITNAARACTKVPIAKAEPSGIPRMPARRKRARNERAAAIIQTTVDRPPTGIPSKDARSLRSAAARTAVPRRVRVRKSPTAIMATGATITAMKSLALRMNEPTVSFQSSGGEMRCDAAFSSHNLGRRMANTASSWVMPMVATVSTSRGEREKRRMMANSTMAPSTMAAARPTPSPNRYGRPENTMSPTARVAGTKPRSAWAKLSTRLARYTRAIPMARRAVSRPITTPRNQAPSGTPKKIS